MARPIKFRAWDKKNKQWLEGNPFTKDLRMNMHGSLSILSSTAEQFGIDIHQIELVEFTGLTDKNRKEIFEGDIIACKFNPGWYERIHWKGEPDAICEVYWDYSGFGLKVVGQDDRRYTTIRDTIGTLEQSSEDLLLMEKSESEVIGNIYENPELL